MAVVGVNKLKHKQKRCKYGQKITLVWRWQKKSCGKKCVHEFGGGMCGLKVLLDLLIIDIISYRLDILKLIVGYF